jgi:hypothetical protein
MGKLGEKGSYYMLCVSTVYGKVLCIRFCYNMLQLGFTKMKLLTCSLSVSVNCNKLEKREKKN